MSLNQLARNGSIQLPSANNTTSTQNNVSTTPASSTQTVSSVNISPVGNSLDPSLYTYDGQTTLYINSTVNQNNNSVQLQYFDPVTGYPNTNTAPYGYPSPMTTGFGNWNFDLTPQNYLNGCVTSSNLLGENTYMYDNLQPPISTPNYLAAYSIDIANANQQSDSSGNSSNTLFFSLTSQPYVSYQGVMYNYPGNTGVPTVNNINPNYTTLGTDTFLFTSQYWVPTNNEIMIVQMVFSIGNTGSTYFSATNPASAISSVPAPIITVTVYNKVISRDMLASMGTGQPCPKPKVYSTGVISLQYLQTGQQFNSSIPSQFMFNNVPIIIADGYKKTFATFGLFYIPPGSEDSSSNPFPNACQFLAASNTAGNTNGDGFTISSNLPTPDTTNINQFPYSSTTGIGITSSGTTLYGHFVVSVAYSYNSSQYNPGTVFTAEVLIKNIWRSPISIYSAYSAFSVNDLINKQVVLLFGKTANGGTFLVTNTGTPLSQVTNYGITSLGNFMAAMKILLTAYNNTYTLSDYFINTTLINNLNSQFGLNIQVVTLQPILEGTMTNPSTVLNCPNMWYLFLNSKNNANLSIDTTYQQVFNSNTSLYLGLSSTSLCNAGLCRYFNSELRMIGTSELNQVTPTYFGNSLYLGLNVINGQSYYMLVVLPEALFNGIPANSTNNNISVFATNDTIFYFMINATTSSAFTPDSNSISSSTSTGNSNSLSVNNTYSVSKIVLPVSNVQLI